VAEFLHDRVQADLLVVAFELRSSVEGADPATRERLERAIAEIERIRSTEVRAASRRLSPAFGSVGLDTALADLAESWESVLRVRVTFDEASRSLLMGGSASRDLLTAIYRVIEQALLNAASHGHATRVDASLSMPSADSLELTVTDDGRGLPRGEIVRGSGTAIMDAWCAVVGGVWSWRSPPAGGAQVIATFSPHP
jgi:signal transduction histidine kinase